MLRLVCSKSVHTEYLLLLLLLLCCCRGRLCVSPLAAAGMKFDASKLTCVSVSVLCADFQVANKKKEQGDKFETSKVPC